MSFENRSDAAQWRCPFCDGLNQWQDGVCQICGDGRRPEPDRRPEPARQPEPGSQPEPARQPEPGRQPGPGAKPADTGARASAAAAFHAGQDAARIAGGAGPEAAAPTPEKPIPAAAPEKPTTAALPLMICAAWIVLWLFMAKENNASLKSFLESYIEQARSGNPGPLLILAAPLIATLILCATRKGVLHVLAAIVMGIASFYSCFVCAFVMKSRLKLGFFLNADSAIGVVTTMAVCLISVVVGVRGGISCNRVNRG